MTERVGDAPFLPVDPPPLVARGLAYLVIAIFLTATIGAIAVKVPEVVTGEFVLMPVRGADPVRTLREGVVADVTAREGMQVQRGSVLFTIRSEPVGDRSATLRMLQAQLAGTAASESNTRAQYQSDRRADEDEVRRLEGHLVSLKQILPLKRSQAVAAATLDSSGRAGYARGVISGDEMSARHSASDRAAIDVATAEADDVETSTSLTKLKDQMDSRAAQNAEAVRALAASRNDMRIRIASLEGDTTDWASGLLSVHAPCDGTVLRLHVRTPGAIVQAGDSLGEVACAGAVLQAEMRVPENGVALLHAGQHARLRYDAFPYQRFGARDGLVEWVGPASVRPDSAGFRALITLDSSSFRVAGDARPLMPGMVGRVDVIVGRRALVSYVFEPLRQLRENLGQGGR